MIDLQNEIYNYAFINNTNRDFFGGRSGTYEKVLREAKESAMSEMEERAAQMGANAIVGIDLDYETIGENGSMLMVTCSGTAVVI